MKENHAEFIDSLTEGKLMFSSLVSQKFDMFCVPFTMFKLSFGFANKHSGRSQGI